MAEHPTIYVTDALASYERKRLIEQKVPFIVPGNQLYLPELGIDLREYFRQRAGSAESPLSPSAQALLITALLRPQWEPEWRSRSSRFARLYTDDAFPRRTRISRYGPGQSAQKRPNPILGNDVLAGRLGSEPARCCAA